MTLLAQAQPVVEVVSTGEAIAFWVLGPLALAGALGMVFARNAVHCALMLAAAMLSLGALYMIQQAPFLGFVQIIVYTGAVMMLFLFVLMLVGRDSSDSVVEVLRGQRLAALALGVGLAVLLVGGIGRALTAVTPAGLAAGRRGLRRQRHRAGPADLHQVPVRVRAHLGAAHHRGTRRDGAGLRPDGARTPSAASGPPSTARLRGEHDRVSPLPGPGVFATANSVAVPALLPDGSIAVESLAEIIDSTPVGEIERYRPGTTTGRALTDRGAAVADADADTDAAAGPNETAEPR